MIPQEREARIVRYGDLRPCRTAFIDFRNVRWGRNRRWRRLDNAGAR